MFPTLLRLGDFRLATYGAFTAAGYLLGIFYLNSQRERLGLSEEKFWRLIYAVFFGALAGGKLLYLAVSWRELSMEGTSLLETLRSGFVFYGGFAGALAAGALMARRIGLPFWPSVDVFALALPLGHAVGRLGCLAAGCCFGRMTALPWGVRFTHPQSLVDDALRGLPLHPVQLYESLGNFAIAAAAALALRQGGGKLKPGSVFLGYVLSYAVLRFIVEQLRADYRGGIFLGLSLSQGIAALLFAGSAALLIRRGVRR